MELYLYQIIAVSISIVMIYIGISNFVQRKAGQTLFKLIIRLIIWGGVAVIALFPQITNIVANAIGMKGNINAVILISIIFILLMIFKLLSAIENLERQVSDIVRAMALRDIEKYEKK